MNHSERDHIAICKRLIEEKFHFENGGETLRQRDLEYLADSIEEKSGVKLSLSTLKRLWKKDYDQMPHPSTLQALVSVLGYKDWQEFKLQSAPVAPPSIPKKKNRSSIRPWIVLPALVVITILIWAIAFRARKPGKTKPIVQGQVSFTGNKTVSQGVPNTIVFNYDVSNVIADSFFFQQSWNPMDKVKLDPNGHYYSNIYYYPGFHKAKLIANDSILKRFRVHITTDGWLPLVRYSAMNNMPIYIKRGRTIVDGALHTGRSDLSFSNVNMDKDFILNYYNVREFENTNSDNFSLDTRIKCDSGSMRPCPDFELVIMCEAHIFFVGLTGKGCERNIALKMGEVIHDGSNSDLSAFGRNLYDWQQLQIKVADKKATIFLDNQAVHTITFKEDFGKVVGLVLSFAGTGAVDYVRLKNGESKVVYEDDFNK